MQTMKNLLTRAQIKLSAAAESDRSIINMTVTVSFVCLLPDKLAILMTFFGQNGPTFFVFFEESPASFSFIFGLFWKQFEFENNFKKIDQLPGARIQTLDLLFMSLLVTMAPVQL